jgi:hypothetical protein
MRAEIPRSKKAPENGFAEAWPLLQKFSEACAPPWLVSAFSSWLPSSLPFSSLPLCFLLGTFSLEGRLADVAELPSML